MTDTFLGYRRADGRVGVRNVVAVLSAMDNTNPSAARIASMVNGTTVLATPFGRGQIGADFEVTRRTLAGIAGHPNVAGVLVLSLSLASGQELAARVRATGKPVEVLGLQETGSALAMTMEGVRIATRLVLAASSPPAGEMLSAPPSHPPSRSPATRTPPARWARTSTWT